MSRPSKYPKELIERGVRLALESERPIAHVAADLGIHPETLRKRVRQGEADSGSRPHLLATQGRGEVPELRRGGVELRRADESFEGGGGGFVKGARPGPPRGGRSAAGGRGRSG